MPMKEMTARNAEIFRMNRRKKDRLGYKKLGQMFGLDPWRIRAIIKREEQKQTVSEGGQ